MRIGIDKNFGIDTSLVKMKMRIDIDKNFGIDTSLVFLIVQRCHFIIRSNTPVSNYGAKRSYCDHFASRRARQAIKKLKHLNMTELKNKIIRLDTGEMFSMISDFSKYRVHNIINRN